MRPDLESIKARCEAAALDPWQAVHDNEHNSLVDAEDRCVAFCSRREDAYAIVQCLADRVALLAHIADLKAERDGIKARSLSVIRGHTADNIHLRDRVANLEADLAAFQRAAGA